MTESAVLVHQPAWADPWSHPEYFTGITAKRIVAYAIDVALIGMAVALIWTFLVVLGIFTFGLAWGVLWLPSLLVPLAYHSLQIGGPRAATLGMRAMGIRVASLLPPPASLVQVEGGRPTLFQAIIQTVAFYVTVPGTGALILLVALFNPRRRTVHDWLAAVVVVNDVGIRGPAAGGWRAGDGTTI